MLAVHIPSFQFVFICFQTYALLRAAVAIYIIFFGSFNLMVNGFLLWYFLVWVKRSL